MRTFVTPIDEARKLGAMMLFGEKYGDEVRVVEIDGFSPRALRRHARPLDRRDRPVRDPRARGSVGSGARRIEAVTAGEAWTMLEGRSRELEAVRAELEQLRREAKKPKAPAAGPGHRLAGPPGQRLRRRGEGRARQRAARPLRPGCGSARTAAAVVLASADDGKVALVVNLDNVGRPRSTPSRSCASSARSSAAAAAAGRRSPRPAARTSTRVRDALDRGSRQARRRSRRESARTRLRLRAHRRRGLRPDRHRRPSRDDGSSVPRPTPASPSCSP